MLAILAAAWLDRKTVARIRSVFCEVIGGGPSRASFVSGLAGVAWTDAALLVLAAALTFLLPRTRPSMAG